MSIASGFETKPELDPNTDSVVHPGLHNKNLWDAGCQPSRELLSIGSRENWVVPGKPYENRLAAS
jgi:hypothetical protein